MNKPKYTGYRPTWAQVDLDKLAYNFRQIKKLLRSGTRVMACVKADAYGHGLVPVAKRLTGIGADYLGVASIDEAIELRRANINLPVLILGAVLKKDIGPLFRYKLSVTVCTRGLACVLNKKAASLGSPVNVHIKVDTGMGRLGVLYNAALEFVKEVRRLKFINIEGIFTHFPLADKDRGFTLRQIDLFRHLIAQLNREGIHIPLAHAANSMGIIGYKNSHFNMVRPGLALYGLYPAKNLKIKLKPVLGLKTKIIYYKKVPRGWGVSYGHTYITKKETNIAVLPIGYGDGYPRNLSNKAPVLIGGKRFKISGTICMDQITVDVGNLPLRGSEEVVLIGSQGENKITAEELACLGGSIPYEIVCGLGSRIPRTYI